MSIKLNSKSTRHNTHNKQQSFNYVRKNFRHSSFPQSKLRRISLRHIDVIKIKTMSPPRRFLMALASVACVMSFSSSVALAATHKNSVLERPASQPGTKDSLGSPALERPSVAARVVRRLWNGFLSLVPFFSQSKKPTKSPGIYEMFNESAPTAYFYVW